MGIINHVSASTLVPYVGFVGAPENLEIFIKVY